MQVMAGEPLQGYFDLFCYRGFHIFALAKTRYGDLMRSFEANAIGQSRICYQHLPNAGIQYKIKGPFVVDLNRNDHQVSEKPEWDHRTRATRIERKILGMRLQTANTQQC